MQSQHRLDGLRDIAEQAAGIDQDDDVGDVVRQQAVVRLALAQRALGLHAEAELREQHVASSRIVHSSTVATIASVRNVFHQSDSSQSSDIATVTTIG